MRNILAQMCQCRGFTDLPAHAALLCGHILKENNILFRFIAPSESFRRSLSAEVSGSSPFKDPNIHRLGTALASNVTSSEIGL